MAAPGRAGGLWAITSHFNPAGYERRRSNFREFRKRLDVPLVAVELSFDGRFELGCSDADVLVRLRGRDVMWQKERLLNVALAHVPAGSAGVAWIDADVVFTRADWAEALARALDRFPLVQLMRDVRDLPRGCDPDRPVAPCVPRIPSTASRIVDGADVTEGLRRVAHRNDRSPANGLAWGARRSLLETHGFYDACILGSGDRALVAAAVGAWPVVADALLMNPAQRRHYQRWAEPFHEAVGGRVGCLDGTIHHLWHGRPEDRRPTTRYRALVPHAFDPARDLAVDPGGGLRWGTDKLALHDAVRTYFPERREDG